MGSTRQTWRGCSPDKGLLSKLEKQYESALRTKEALLNELEKLSGKCELQKENCTGSNASADFGSQNPESGEHISNPKLDMGSLVGSGQSEDLGYTNGARGEVAQVEDSTCCVVQKFAPTATGKSIHADVDPNEQQRDELQGSPDVKGGHLPSTSVTIGGSPKEDADSPRGSIDLPKKDVESPKENVGTPELPPRSAPSKHRRTNHTGRRVPPESSYIFSLISNAKKTITTKDWKVTLEEARRLRLLEHTSNTRKNQLWGFNGSEQVDHAPQEHLLHWDYLVDEALWLQADFQLERRWKITVLYLISYEVMHWHHERNLRLSQKVKTLADETSSAIACPAGSNLPFYFPLVSPQSVSADPQLDPSHTQAELDKGAHSDSHAPISLFELSCPLSPAPDLYSCSKCRGTIHWQDLDSTITSLIDEFDQSLGSIAGPTEQRCPRGFFKNFPMYGGSNFNPAARGRIAKSSSKGPPKKRRSSDESSRTYSAMTRIYNVFCWISNAAELKQADSARVVSEDGISSTDPSSVSLQNIKDYPTPTPYGEHKSCSSLSLSLAKREFDNAHDQQPIEVICPRKFDVLSAQVTPKPDDTSHAAARIPYQRGSPKHCSYVDQPQASCSSHFPAMHGWFQDADVADIRRAAAPYAPPQQLGYFHSRSPHFRHNNDYPHTPQHQPARSQCTPIPDIRFYDVHMRQSPTRTGSAVRQDGASPLYPAKFNCVPPPCLQMQHYKLHSTSPTRHVQCQYYNHVYPSDLRYHQNFQGHVSPNVTLPQGPGAPVQVYPSLSPHYKQFVLMCHNDQHMPSYPLTEKTPIPNFQPRCKDGENL